MQCKLPRKIQITPNTYTLTLSGDRLSSSYGYVIIKGITYSSAQTLVLPVRTTVDVTVANSYGFGNSVTLNGSEVSSSGTYSFEMASNTTIDFSSNGLGTTAAITTE